MRQRTFIRSFTASLATLLLMMICSCGNTAIPAPESSEPGTSSSEASSPEPREPQTVTVPASDLGLEAFYILPDETGTVGAAADENGNIVITSEKPGKTVITVKNVYAEEAYINAEVTDLLGLTCTAVPFVPGKSLNAVTE